MPLKTITEIFKLIDWSSDFWDLVSAFFLGMTVSFFIASYVLKKRMESI